MTTVVLERVNDRPRLVIDSAEELAARFFRDDPSSAAFAAFDKKALENAHPDRVTVDDIVAINSTFAARSPHSAWAPLLAEPGPLPWLSAIDPSWDLIETEPEAWEQARCAEHVARALFETVAKGRQLAVATKVLHLKRRRLFPVLDSLVVQQLGAPPAASPIDLVLLLRAQGRANLEQLREIRATLPVDRTLVRILDALLWVTHPGAGARSTLQDWQVRVEPRGG